MKFTRVAYGMIVGAIYKPDSRPGASSRPVGFRGLESGLGINGAQENRGATMTTDSGAAGTFFGGRLHFRAWSRLL